MIRISRYIFTICIFLALAVAANADPISLAGGTLGDIPSGATNEFIGVLFPGPLIGGYYGSQILVDIPGGGVLFAEYFGAEAGYHNEFNLNGAEAFDHPSGTEIAPNLSSPFATYVLGISGTGVLPFSFDVNSDALTLTNGSNPDDSAHTPAGVGPNFFATFNPFSDMSGTQPTQGQVVYLFLDDGGAGPDDNHDDFLVRLTLQPVPEPSALLLLGAGIIGLFALGRKFGR